VGVSETCAFPGYYAASSGNRCVITQKSAILKQIAAEAWNHASWNVTTCTVYTCRCIHCVQPVYHTTLLNILLSLPNKQMRVHSLEYWVRVVLPAAAARWVDFRNYTNGKQQWIVHAQQFTSVPITVFTRLLSVNEERHNIHTTLLSP